MKISLDCILYIVNQGGKTFIKGWNEWWFLTEPESFIYTHLPMMRDGTISLDHQMIKNSYTSAKIWDIMVERSPATYAFKMKPLSHSETRITTNESVLVLKYSCQVKLYHCVSLEMQEVNGNSFTSTKLQDSWYILYEKNGIVTVHIRFPKAGVYILRLLAKVITGDEQVKAKTIQSLMYRITYNGKSGVPFPHGLGHNWGELPNFLACLSLDM